MLNTLCTYYGTFDEGRFLQVIQLCKKMLHTFRMYRNFSSKVKYEKNRTYLATVPGDLEKAKDNRIVKFG